MDNQCKHRLCLVFCVIQSLLSDSNQQHPHYKCVALPLQLRRRNKLTQYSLLLLKEVNSFPYCQSVRITFWPIVIPCLLLRKQTNVTTLSGTLTTDFTLSAESLILASYYAPRRGVKLHILDSNQCMTSTVNLLKCPVSGQVSYSYLLANALNQTELMCSLIQVTNNVSTAHDFGTNYISYNRILSISKTIRATSICKSYPVSYLRIDVMIRLLVYLLRRVDSNHRPQGYEPCQLPLLHATICEVHYRTLFAIGFTLY